MNSSAQSSIKGKVKGAHSTPFKGLSLLDCTFDPTLLFHHPSHLHENLSTSTKDEGALIPSQLSAPSLLSRISDPVGFIDEKLSKESYTVRGRASALQSIPTAREHGAIIEEQGTHSIEMSTVVSPVNISGRKRRRSEMEGEEERGEVGSGAEHAWNGNRSDNITDENHGKRDEAVDDSRLINTPEYDIPRDVTRRPSDCKISVKRCNTFRELPDSTTTHTQLPLPPTPPLVQNWPTEAPFNNCVLPSDTGSPHHHHMETNSFTHFPVWSQAPNKVTERPMPLTSSQTSSRAPEQYQNVGFHFASRNSASQVPPTVDNMAIFNVYGVQSPQQPKVMIPRPYPRQTFSSASFGQGSNFSSAYGSRPQPLVNNNIRSGSIAVGPGVPNAATSISFSQNISPVQNNFGPRSLVSQSRQLNITNVKGVTFHSPSKSPIPLEQKRRLELSPFTQDVTIYDVFQRHNSSVRTSEPSPFSQSVPQMHHLSIKPVDDGAYQTDLAEYDVNLKSLVTRKEHLPVDELDNLSDDKRVSPPQCSSPDVFILQARTTNSIGNANINQTEKVPRGQLCDAIVHPSPVVSSSSTSMDHDNHCCKTKCEEFPKSAMDTQTSNSKLKLGRPPVRRRRLLEDPSLTAELYPLSSRIVGGQCGVPDQVNVQEKENKLSSSPIIPQKCQVDISSTSSASPNSYTYSSELSNKRHKCNQEDFDLGGDFMPPNTAVSVHVESNKEIPDVDVDKEEVVTDDDFVREDSSNDDMPLGIAYPHISQAGSIIESRRSTPTEEANRPYKAPPLLFDVEEACDYNLIAQRHKRKKSAKKTTSLKKHKLPVIDKVQRASLSLIARRSRSSTPRLPGTVFWNEGNSDSWIVERSVVSDDCTKFVVDGEYSAAWLVRRNPEGFRCWFRKGYNVGAEAEYYAPEVYLEYPGGQSSELFVLVYPTAHDGYEYHPIDDLRKVISLVLQFYLTPQQVKIFFGGMSTDDNSPSEQTSLLNQLDRAYLSQDGIAFMSAVDWYNRVIRELKANGTIQKNIREMNGLPLGLWEPIFDQTYERTVGPNVGQLNKYESWSDNVYGELLPSFLQKIFYQTGLKEGMVFVDLGSGVSNCTIQAALATGCDAYGYENLHSTAVLGSLQVAEAKKRWQMWGLKGGHVEAREDDIVISQSLGELMGKADVILCNNQVFSASLNRSIADRFLDLREGTLIVSLQPFKATDFKLSMYKCNSVEAILKQSPPLEYQQQHVSWTDKAGTYFLTKIDREELRLFMEHQEYQQSRTSRTTIKRKKR